MAIVMRIIPFVSIVGLCLLTIIPHKTVMDQVRVDQIVSAGLLLSEICTDEDAGGGDCPNCRLQNAILFSAVSLNFEADLVRSERALVSGHQAIIPALVVTPPQRAPPRPV